jgi:hypothetical protein
MSPPDLTKYRTHFRVIAAVVIAFTLAFLASGSLTADPNLPERVDSGTVAPPSNGTTVITTQSYGKKGWHHLFTGESPGELIAVDSSGSVAYYDNQYQSYWDVDPSPAGEATVLYVASEYLSPTQCHATTECYRNRVMRTNLTTGESEPLFDQMVPNEPSVRYHDVDRIDSDSLAIADIARDRVYVVNTTSEMIEWEWDLQSDYPTTSGGEYPHDWAHLNDVEVLPDGRLLVSLRNQDQVVFLDRRTGVQSEWTLGSEDEYRILKEQHNPDYLTNENGVPSLLVADSGNDRVVEYARTNGSWTQTWAWNDSRLAWPRDADRLPNGNTLITDSNGGRVLETNADGDVVWSMDIALPYEAERLGTGDESTDGPPGRAANLETSVERPAGTSEFSLRGLVFTLFPGEVLVAISWILPKWMGVTDAGVLFFGTGVAITWGTLELYWRRSRLTGS